MTDIHPEMRAFLDQLDFERLDDQAYLDDMRERIEPHLDDINEHAVDREANEPGRTSVVYFVRLGNRIKIGWSTNLAQRLSNLQPEEVLAVIPGDTTLERELHRRFAKHRVVGEWFEDCPSIRAYIAGLPT